MDLDKPKNCPFCNWHNIDVMIQKSRRKFNKGDSFTYCLCRVCGAQGPWAWVVKDTNEENYNDCVKRWNERSTEITSSS